MGSDATANAGTHGGAVEMVAEEDSSIHVASSVVATGGRGGNSDQAYGGTAPHDLVPGWRHWAKRNEGHTHEGRTQ